MRWHTNVSKSLRRVSLVQRTQRQARCLLQLLLGICPSSHQPDEYGTRSFWHFWAQGRIPHAPGMDKNTFSPVGIPLIRGASAPGNKTEGSKSLGGRSPETGGNLQLPRHTRPDPYRSKHGRAKCNPTTGETQCYYSCFYFCEYYTEGTRP